MPFNPSGIYQRLYDWVTDRDNSVKIMATRMDDETNGIVDAINEVTAGNRPFRSSISLANGTAASPGARFDSDTDTGLYRVSADKIGLAAGGSLAFTASATQAQVLNGTVALPALAGINHASTGLYFPSADVMSVAAFGQEVMRFTQDEINAKKPINGSGSQAFAKRVSGVGGTANAITLTAGIAPGLVAGVKLRFMASVPNTGATTINVDGLGAVACVTKSGAALPSDYIIAGVETEAYYNGTNWVISRQAETGSNANGRYTRFADGTQICWAYLDGATGGSHATAMATGTTFFTPTSFLTWTYPASFVGGVGDIIVTGSLRRGGIIASGIHVYTPNASSLNFVPWSSVSLTAADQKNFSFQAVGRWY